MKTYHFAFETFRSFDSLLARWLAAAGSADQSLGRHSAHIIIIIIIIIID
jgi:hypothetical protein